MKAHYRVSSGRITFEVEGENPKVLFRELAAIQEVFDAETQCGVCHGTAIRLQARKVDDFDFYELLCMNQECRARFQFGQAKKGGGLFPKRKDEDGHWLPNGGWSRYEPQGTAEPVKPTVAPPKPGPRSVAAPPGPTPEGLQPSFDRLGVLFNVAAPTRIGSALDLIRDQMNDAAGNAGTNQFDQIYRKFEAEAGAKQDAGKLKALLRDLMGALDKLKLEVA